MKNLYNNFVARLAKWFAATKTFLKVYFTDSQHHKVQFALCTLCCIIYMLITQSPLNCVFYYFSGWYATQLCCYIWKYNKLESLDC